MSSTDAYQIQVIFYKARNIIQAKPSEFIQTLHEYSNRAYL